VSGWKVTQYADLLSLLREVFRLTCVDTANLQVATSVVIYKELTCTLPILVVEQVRGTCLGTTSGRGWRIPPWWPRKSASSSFCCKASLGDGSLTCLPDLPASNSLGDHPALFTSCSRTSAAWYLLFFKATITLGVALTDKTLLYLAWPPLAAWSDAAVVLAVTILTAWAWATRSSPEVLAPNILQARITRAASDSFLFSIL
jgi:hypothetical protein